MSIGLRTLVLNANYMPISIFPLQDGTIPVEDAVTRVVNGTCHVVFEYDRDILTQRVSMKWPSVIARVDGKLIKERIKLNDETLYYRDHGMCAYCEEPITLNEITWDHVVPKSRGGNSSWENLVAACEDCNMKKGNHAPIGVWMPKRKPFRPSYYDLLNARRKFPITIDHQEWMQFLGNWEAEVTVKGAA